MHTSAMERSERGLGTCRLRHLWQMPMMLLEGLRQTSLLQTSVPPGLSSCLSRVQRGTTGTYLLEEASPDAPLGTAKVPEQASLELTWEYACSSLQDAALDRLQQECVRTAEWLAPYTRALGRYARC